MADSDLQKLGNSHEVLFGPRGIIAYGFKVKERPILLKVVGRSFPKGIAVSFPTDEQTKSTLAELFALPNKSGYELKSSVARTMIVSGSTEAELHRVMANYKASSLERPLWATVTPTSIEWPLEELVSELRRERQALS